MPCRLQQAPQNKTKFCSLISSCGFLKLYKVIERPILDKIQSKDNKTEKHINSSTTFLRQNEALLHNQSGGSISDLNFASNIEGNPMDRTSQMLCVTNKSTDLDATKLDIRFKY